MKSMMAQNCSAVAPGLRSAPRPAAVLGGLSLSAPCGRRSLGICNVAVPPSPVAIPTRPAEVCGEG